MSHRPSDHDFRFEPLDRAAPIEIRTRNLPHWFQAGTVLFVTLRTLDSTPSVMLRRWQATLEDWLARQGQPRAMATAIVRGRRPRAEAALRRLTLAQQRAFRQVKHRLWDRGLDDGHGACLLRHPALAQLAAGALLHFEGERYHLDSFVVMPNHIHLLVQIVPPATLRQVSGGWMRYSARQINASVGRAGGFWQPEAFDHVVRSAGQFDYLRRYIRRNPRQARLRDREFLYWSRQTE